MDRLLILGAGGGITVSLFAAALLLSRARGGGRADRVLALLLGVYALNIAHPLLAAAWPDLLPAPPVPFLAEPMQFLLAPLIAAYFRALIRPGFRPRARHLLHLIPFAAVIGVSVSPAPVALDRAAAAPLAAIGLWALLVVQLLAYLIPSYGLLREHRRALKEQLSNTAGVDLGWLLLLHNLILAFFVSYAVMLALLVHGGPAFNPRVVLCLGLSLFVCALGYGGLRQRAVATDAEAEGPRYAHSALAVDEANALRRRLERVMETDKAYLDPELDLSTLAALLGMPRNRLSYVINSTSGGNFYDYINGYRVREVLRLMEDPSRSRDTLLSLAFDAGFSSKPTFNAVFKKHTGRSPSEHRRSGKKNV
jgi:AraC-like DNA-binding protein